MTFFPSLIAKNKTLKSFTVHASCWFHCCQGDHLSLLTTLPRPCCWLSKLRCNAKSWLNRVLGADTFLQAELLSYDSHDCLLRDTQFWRVCASIMSQVFNDIRRFTDNFSFGSPHALHTSLGIFLKIETVQVTSHDFSSHVMSCCCQYRGLQYCRKNLIILKEFLRFNCLGSPYTSTHTHQCRNISSKNISLVRGKSLSWLTVV